MKKHTQTGSISVGRRRFLECAGAAAIGAAGMLWPLLACSSKKSAPGLEAAKKEPGVKGSLDRALAARVVSAADPKVFEAKGRDAERVEHLVGRAVARLVDVKDPKEAFRALFDPREVVAIKLNCLAGPGLSSSVTVAHAVAAGLRSIGIPNENIIFWERATAEMERAGFEPNRSSRAKPLCFGTDDAGFEPDLSFSGDVGSLWSNVIARRATALVNLPVLKDHDLSGVGCGMKNMYGAIHNPNRYHDNNCDPFVADVSNHPYVKNKLRLVLADALTAQYHGGPASVRAHQWKPATVLAAKDPVALDRVAQEMIEEQRSAHGMASLKEAKRPPKWLQTAAKYGLGEADREKIALIET